MKLSLLSLVFFVILCTSVLAEGRIVKIEKADRSVIKAELLAVKDAYVFLQPEKIDESSLAELKRSIRIIPLNEIQAAHLLSEERLVTPLKGFLGGVLFGIVYQLYKLDLSKGEENEFSFIELVYGAAGGMGLAILLNYLIPDDYIRLDSISEESLRQYARFPEAVPGWFNQLNLPEKK